MALQMKDKVEKFVEALVTDSLRLVRVFNE